MPLIESVYRIAEICAQAGVENVIACPGSRSAALTLAFARHPQFTSRVIADERSAAFVAIGLAQITRKTTVLICTSGTAVLNFAPAVAEAFFQGIPLLVITADRPKEWINQHDGQTIYQENVFGRHVVKSFNFLADFSHPDVVWQVERDTYEALAWAKKGPVHINVPIREPFYPAEDERFLGVIKKVTYRETSKVLSENEWVELLRVWKSSEQILIAVGQNHDNIGESLQALNKNVVVVADVISNVNTENKITFHDTFLVQDPPIPDLLITTGKSFISKELKLYFRTHQPKVHWHIEQQTDFIDPFKTITDKLEVAPNYFFKELVSRITFCNKQPLSWLNFNDKAKAFLEKFMIDCPFGELRATYLLFQQLSSEVILHLGNSMPVRYGNLLSGFLSAGIEVFANRGTSGIDGIVSTAVGHALGTNKEVWVILGDVSFFYDSNALFAAKVSNLNVVVINNRGGNIFRIINGPDKQTELETHFVTSPGRTAESLCREAGLQYFSISSEEDLKEALKYKKSGFATLFEVFTDGTKDAEWFKKLKKATLFYE